MNAKPIIELFYTWYHLDVSTKTMHFSSTSNEVCLQKFYSINPHQTAFIGIMHYIKASLNNEVELICIIWLS